MYVYTLPTLFQSVVQRFPEKKALFFNDRQALSFVDLEELSNKCAHFLREQGVNKGDVVSIIGEKTPLIFAMILGCLKIGALYSFLDPDSPIVRVLKIVENCRPKIILTSDSLLSGLQRHYLKSRGAPKLFNVLDSDLEAQIQSLPVHFSLAPRVTGETGAYVMYTSGSTGFPKGAVMTHSNVLNFIQWAKKEFSFSESDRLTNLNPLYFDNSVFDFYTSLFNSASLVALSKEEVSHPKTLVEVVERFECTSWFSVPSLLIFLQSMRALSAERFPAMRRIIFGGEGFPKGKLKLLYDMLGARIQFLNVYGPTECTCMCSSYEISEDDFADMSGFPPLGKIIENFDWLILGEDGKGVQDGESGELCLLGPNVGKGYFNDTERTERSFVQNPLHNSYREIIYKTGDLVRLSQDDEKIHILGRVDNQVKQMGYRIELEEIENALCCIDEIEQAAVVQIKRGGISRLVAVVQINHQIEIGATQEAKLRSQLLEIVPSYMVPQDIICQLEPLQKNANGKINRGAISEWIQQQEGM